MKVARTTEVLVKTQQEGGSWVVAAPTEISSPRASPARAPRRGGGSRARPRRRSACLDRGRVPGIGRRAPRGRMVCEHRQPEDEARLPERHPRVHGVHGDRNARGVVTTVPWQKSSSHIAAILSIENRSRASTARAADGTRRAASPVNRSRADIKRATSTRGLVSQSKLTAGRPCAMALASVLDNSITP
jgi:hypothetical protein